MPLRVALCLLTTCLVAHAATLVRWDGSRIEGSLAYARNSWRIDDGKQRHSLDAYEVYSIRFDARRHAASGDLARVTLVDGSTLSGQLQPSSRLTTIPLERGGGAVELPSEDVALMEFGPLDPGTSPEELPAPPYVIMRNGKVVQANVDWLTWLDVGISTEAGRIRLKRDQVHRVALRALKVETPKEGSVQLSTIQGDVVNGLLVSLDDTWAVLRVGKQDLRFARKRLLRIDRHDQRAHSLLSLGEPTVKTTPYLSLIRQPQFNRSLFAGALQAHGIRYQEGIASHSRCSISYPLNGRFTHFLVDVGIDAAISHSGNARCIVRGDGKELSAVTVTGDGAVQSLLCPVAGVKRLELLVDYGEGGSSGDYVTWGDPRLLSK